MPMSRKRKRNPSVLPENPSEDIHNKVDVTPSPTSPPPDTIGVYVPVDRYPTDGGNNTLVASCNLRSSPLSGMLLLLHLLQWHLDITSQYIDNRFIWCGTDMAKNLF